jgi:hypothetical protein
MDDTNLARLLVIRDHFRGGDHRVTDPRVADIGDSIVVGL